MNLESNSSKILDDFLDLHIRVLGQVLIQKNWKSIESEFKSEFERFDYINSAQILNALAFDESGNLRAAYPISPRKNQFQITVDEVGSGYAMCAIDSLGVAYTFGKKVIILSRDPTTGKELQIIIDPDKENFADYSEIVITSPKDVLRPVDDEIIDQSRDICPYVGFVSNIDLISEEDRYNYSILTFDQALSYAKLAFSRGNMKKQFLEFFNYLSLLYNAKSVVVDDFVKLYSENSVNPAITTMNHDDLKKFLIGQMKGMQLITEVEQSGEKYIELTEVALKLFDVFN
jgi:hypothetical protein